MRLENFSSSLHPSKSRQASSAGSIGSVYRLVVLDEKRNSLPHLTPSIFLIFRSDTQARDPLMKHYYAARAYHDLRLLFIPSSR